MTACKDRASRLIVSLGIAVALMVGTTAARAGRPADGTNACGCRKDPSSGACYCDRKAKCGCPGECEPKGCDDKRAKQLEKQVEVETKKAEAAARKQRAVETKHSPARPVEAAAPKHPVRQMTAAQRRSLQHLLELYVAEHPDARQKTIDEARIALTGPEHRGH